MNLNKKINRLEKVLIVTAILLMSTPWIEIILVIFLKYKSISKIIYNNYGIDGLSMYFGTIYMVAILLIWSRSQIHQIKMEFNRKFKNNNCDI